MPVTFGIFVIALIVVAKLISIFSTKLQNSQRLKNFVNYGTSDRICRIIQYVTSGIVGSNDPHISNLYTYFNLSRFVGLDKLNSLWHLMSDVRKVLRFIRSPFTVREVIKNRNIFSFNYNLFTFKSISKICQYIGDIFDVLFYFTDHYFSFLMLGIVVNHDLNEKLEFIGHIAWIINGFFLFFAAAFEAIQINKKVQQNKEDKIKTKLCILEMISNFFQFILGFCFIFPLLFRRQIISLMVIISSVAKLYKFAVN